MLTLQDQERLANIRAQMMQWAAVEPGSQHWDAMFLIRVIDRLIEESKCR